MDDDDSQQFSLRWHNHQSSVVGALGQLLRSGALSDVTLCAAGATLRAHRVVLAACSQYFAQIFKEVEGDGGGSLVVVAGCGAAELRLLLTFMYTGEVTAARARLPALLALARTLRVSGLADTQNVLATSESEPLNLEKPLPQPERCASEIATEPDRDRPSGLSQPECETSATEGDRLSRLRPECSSETAVGSERDRLSRLDQIVQNLYSTHKLAMTPLASAEAADKRSECGVCGKRLSNQYNLRVHLDTHAGRRHACRACPHVSRSRDALRKHVAYRHARAPRLAPTPAHHTRNAHFQTHDLLKPLSIDDALASARDSHDMQTDTHALDGHADSLARDRLA